MAGPQDSDKEIGLDKGLQKKLMAKMEAEQQRAILRRRVTDFFLSPVLLGGFVWFGIEFYGSVGAAAMGYGALAGLCLGALVLLQRERIQDAIGL